jgi:hypothetical protein
MNVVVIKQRGTSLICCGNKTLDIFAGIQRSADNSCDVSYFVRRTRVWPYSRIQRIRANMLVGTTRYGKGRRSSFCHKYGEGVTLSGCRLYIFGTLSFGFNVVCCSKASSDRTRVVDLHADRRTFRFAYALGVTCGFRPWVANLTRLAGPGRAGVSR